MQPGVVPLDLVVHMQIFRPWPNHLLADGAVANPHRVDLVGSDGESCGDWPGAHGIAALDTAATVVDSLLPADPSTPPQERIYRCYFPAPGGE